MPVYEIDRGSGLYFTMKWVDGGSLSRHVPRLVGDPLAAARLLATVARAVHDAHRHGYLHRDLKPANILLDAQGKPYVTDFGLARRLGEDSGLTQSGAILGTPSYMAPEQAGGHGEEVGPTADVYSLGAVLYELLVGRPPFRAATVMETLVLVLERDPTPPRRLKPGVPRRPGGDLPEVPGEGSRGSVSLGGGPGGGPGTLAPGRGRRGDAGRSLAPAPTLDAPGTATGHTADRPGIDPGADPVQLFHHPRCASPGSTSRSRAP